MNKEIPIQATRYEGTLVIIEDYDPTRHLVKVKRLADNKPLEDNNSFLNATPPVKVYEAQDKRVFKVDDSPNSSLVEVTSGSARLGGSPDTGFISYKEGGNFVKGPTSFVCMPNEIRLSGLSTLNPLILTGIPSTLVTPIPTCIWSIPGVGMIQPLLKDVLMMSTLVAACGG